MNQEDIIEGLKIACICRGIGKKTFLRTISDGHGPRDALQKATGAGSGSCGDRRCTPRPLQRPGPSERGPDG